jgi:enterochelin esterase-like enzyme
MKKSILLTFIIAFWSISSFAQQALGGASNIISPEVNNNQTVTFRLLAPNAQEVKLSGDWLPTEGFVPGSVNMTKGAEGLWTYTTAALPSDLYMYSFQVDGFKTTDPNNVYLIRDVATVTNVFIVGNGKADLYKVNDVPHGTVARRWYDSPGNNIKRRVTIYTPPNYESTNEKYPVLYLLHGAGGDEEAWIALGRASQIMDNLIAQGKAKPMIVVMTNGNNAQEAAPGESSLGMYKPSMQVANTAGKMEESFPDVIKFIESNYRVNADKANRAIAGLSMGGGHTINISRLHPNTFDYMGVFSAPGAANGDAAYNNTLEVQKANGFKLYWIAVGKTDFLFDRVTAYRAKLDQMGFPYQYRESEGGHTWTNWRDYLSEFAPMLFK